MIDATWKPAGYDFDTVWIKGAKFPDSCAACDLKVNCDACEGREVYCPLLRKDIGYESEVLTDRRRDDCPLRVISFHGFSSDTMMGGGSG